VVSSLCFVYCSLNCVISQRHRNQQTRLYSGCLDCRQPVALYRQTLDTFLLQRRGVPFRCAGQGSSISPKGYLTSPSGAAKMPFWDAPSEAAEAVRSRTGSVDQQPPGFAEALAGA